MGWKTASSPIRAAAPSIPVKFQCSDTNKSECLTPVQVEAARHIYAGAKKSDGTVLMPGQVRGSELGWFAQSGGATPGGSSWDFWRQAVFQDPDFKNVNFDFDRDTERALATKVSGASLAEVYDEKVEPRCASGRVAESSSSSRAGRIR